MTATTQLSSGQATPERDPRRWFVLAVMSLGTLIVFLDTTVINTALPSIAVDLQASTSQLQWVIDSYVLVLAGLLMLGGSLGDRYGRKKWMAIGLVTFAIGSAIGGLADSIEQLILARGVQGLGAAMVLPATLSIVTNVFDRDERPKAIAIWTAVSGMGIGLGPAVGGYLVEQYDWPASFWIHIPVLFVGLVGLIWVAESKDSRQVGLDIPGAVFGTLGISALVYGVIQGGEQGWTSGIIITAFAVSIVSLALFVQVERTSSSPMLPLQFFKKKDFTGSVLSLGLMFFSGIVLFFFLTQFLQLVQGRSPFEAGMLVLPNAAFIILGSGLGQVAAKRIGPRITLMAAMSIMTIGVLWFTTLDADVSGGQIIAMISVFGFGFGIGAAPLTDMVMAAVPVEDAGVGSAVNDISRELGAALGVATIGSFVSALYRSNISDSLDGEVPGEVVEAAQEGLGAVTFLSQSLPADVAATTVDAANVAFLDAMTTGFWLSAGVLAVGVVLAGWLLPAKMRTVQVEREDGSAGKSAAGESGVGDLGAAGPAADGSAADDLDDEFERTFIETR